MLRLQLNKGLAQKVQSALKTAPEKISTGMRKAMQAIAMDMHAKAVTLSPFDKGNLRRSLTNQATDSEASMGSNLVYARIQDLGGMAGRGRRSKIPRYNGQGYMTPAFEEQKEGKALETISKQLEKIFQD